MEGDTTQLVVQFLEKLGIVVEGYTQVVMMKREMPRQVDYK